MVVAFCVLRLCVCVSLRIIGSAEANEEKERRKDRTSKKENKQSKKKALLL